MTQLARIEKVVVLESVDFFSGCRAQELVCLSAIARQRDIAAREIVYRQGDEADALYAVISGRVRVDEGTRDELEFGPLQTFGVAEVLAGRRRCCEAVALEDVRVLAIETDDFFDLLSHNTDVLRAVFAAVLEGGVRPDLRGATGRSALRS